MPQLSRGIYGERNIIPQVPEIEEVGEAVLTFAKSAPWSCLGSERIGARAAYETRLPGHTAGVVSFMPEGHNRFSKG